MTKKIPRSILASVVICVLLASDTAESAEFIPLGDLPGGDTISGVRGLSQNGELIIGRSGTANGLETFVWTRSMGMMQIPGLPTDQSPNPAFGSATGNLLSQFNTSSDGTVVLTKAPHGGNGVYAWSSQLGAQLVTDHLFDEEPQFALSLDGSTIVGRIGDDVLRWQFDDLASGPETLFSDSRTIILNTVSSDGTTVGGRFGTNSAGTNPAYVWNESAGLVELEFARTGDNVAAVSHFSSDGSRAIGASFHFREPRFSSQSDLFVWTEEDGVTSLTSPDDFAGLSGWGLTARGATPSLSHVVGGVFIDDNDIGFRPFIWSEVSGFEIIQLPGELALEQASLLDISDDGRRIVGRVESRDRLFLVDNVWGTRWLEDILTEEFDLADELQGWTLAGVGLISADGNVIAGHGTNPVGNTEAWVAILDDVAVQLPGDYNNNGLIEQGDLDLVLLHWGADAACVPPTWTNDLPIGAIDQDELDKVLLGWGSSSTTVATTAAAVPEPATWLVAIIAGFTYGFGILPNFRSSRPIR